LRFVFWIISFSPVIFVLALKNSNRMLIKKGWGIWPDEALTTYQNCVAAILRKVPIPAMRKAWIDKSAFKLTNSFQNIQSSPDLSGELFCLGW